MHHQSRKFYSEAQKKNKTKLKIHGWSEHNNISYTPNYISKYLTKS